MLVLNDSVLMAEFGNSIYHYTKKRMYHCI